MRHHRRRYYRSALGILVMVVLITPSVANAQRVRGLVVESGTNEPLYGAIIVLLDSTNAQVAGAITDSLGRFTLTAPAPGHYALRANRIGFRSTRSESFALAAGQTLVDARRFRHPCAARDDRCDGEGAVHHAP